MSALAQCDAFAYIYDQAGDPAPDVLVVLKRVIDASGNPILLGPKTTLTDSAGSFHFTLPEFATAFISARASALWNCPDGRAFTVPPGPSGELVPDFSLPPSTLVEPPLVYVGDVLSIPRASASQDGYLSAADFVAFEAGAADMGITQIDTGAGLTGGPITEPGGTISLQPISGVEGTWSNPSSISINAYGQIVAITPGAPDTTAPLISAVTTPTITGSSATINWHTNEPADSQVDYSTDLSYGASTPLDTTPVLDHSVTLGTLAPLTPYHFKVKSKDAASPPNAAIPVTGTFTTTAALDTTPPVITLASTPVDTITDVAATIHWTTNEAADSQVDYSTDTSYGTHSPITDPVPPGITTHAVMLTGLAQLTTYHYRVNSKDAAGNPAIPVTGTFTTIATVVPVDLLTDLIAYWKLDETSGLRADSSGGGNTLTPTIAFATATGKFGSLCPQFVADNNTLRADAGGVFGAMGGGIDYTISMWVQIADESDQRIMLGKVAGVGAPKDEYLIKFEWGTSGDILRWMYTVQTTSGTYYSVAATDTGEPALNTWYLITIWHKASDSTMHIQVNGGTENSFTLVEPVVSGDSIFALGAYGPSSSIAHHIGLIDEVAFWKNRALTTAERAALWSSGAGKPFNTW